MNIGIVTGASSGMGREMARLIARQYQGLDAIWVVARRERRLERLREELERFGVPLRPLPLDLTDNESLEYLGQLLEEERPVVRILVNAAGVGSIGRLWEMSWEDCARMIDLNCKALTAVTRLVLPYMGRGGRMLLFSSLAAFAPQPGFAVYAATKAYVLSFSRAVRQELSGRNISVTAVCPGPVDTEFFVTAERTGRVAGYKKLFFADAAQVARAALRDARRGREVSVYGANMKLIRFLAKALPHRLLLKLLNSSARA